MPGRIDINADVGEGFAYDGDLIKLISSANIACGGHAGDRETIGRTLDLALEHNVAIGAHPGFEDKAGFGRRPLRLPIDVLKAQLHRQMERFQRIAESRGISARYVKLHGALANMTSTDGALAFAAYQAVADIVPGIPVLAIARSAQIRAAMQLGLKSYTEAFADRAYTHDGLLVSRAVEGAVLHDVSRVIKQVHSLVSNQTVFALTGERIALPAQSVCVHGDNEKALELVTAIRENVIANGGTIRPFVQEQ